MKKTLWILMCAGFVLVGCHKNRQVVATADQLKENGETGTTSQSAKMKAPKQTHPAADDMQEVLLALQRVHFAFDSAELNVSSKQALAEAAEKLIAHADVHLYVDGHTDELGTTEYNMSLGDRRAREVISYLKNYGVDPGRLSAVSFGEESPLDNGQSDESYARNRRVDFRLMSGEVQFILEDSEPIQAGIHSMKGKQSKSGDAAGTNFQS